MWVVNGLLQTATDAIQREKWITVKRGQRSHTSLMVKGDSHQAGKASEMENLKSEYLFMNRTERRGIEEEWLQTAARKEVNELKMRLFLMWCIHLYMLHSGSCMSTAVWTTCRNEFSEEQASTDVGVIVMRSLDARWSALVCEHDTFCMMKPCREKKKTNKKKTLGANENFMAQCLHSSSISSSHHRKNNHVLGEEKVW